MVCNWLLFQRILGGIRTSGLARDPRQNQAGLLMPGPGRSIRSLNGMQAHCAVWTGQRQQDATSNSLEHPIPQLKLAAVKELASYLLLRTCD